MQPDTSQAFIAESRNLLTTALFPRIERCLERLSEEEVWWRANPDSNSVGNLLLHLSGNVRQWIVSGVGGAPDHRQRQQEFDERGPVPRGELLERLRATVRDADRALAELSSAALLDRRTIQGCDVTVLEAVYHVVEHFSMHVGQIILITKMFRGDLGLYDVSDGTPRPQWLEQHTD
jgi:uncharacterized damage-inducible protein DinB